MSELKSHSLYGLLLIVVLSFFNKASGIANKNVFDFKYCMRQSKQPRLTECVGRTAITYLQHFDEQENFTLASDFISRKDDKIASRSLVNMLDTDPVDFRGILENAGAVFSQRSLEWHMDNLYPGLMFKIGPTGDTNSVAEFVLDPAVAERHFVYEEPSTPRILAKQYLLPFLLGLKFNLVALVPLLFAGICLLLKKSLFFAKLAIYISSLLGVGGAVGTLGGGLGGFGGFGGLLNGLGGGFVPPIAHATAHAHAQAGAQAGYYPGKVNTHQHYDDLDDLQYHTPYKRNDRKVNFNKPRQFTASDLDQSAAKSSTLAPDRFYDFEKRQQERNSKAAHESSSKLEPSAYEEDGRTEHLFKPSQQLGWKVIDARSLN